MTDLTLEVESRQVIQQRMGQRIREEMWDDMEVKGKAIKVSTLLLSTKLNFATYVTTLQLGNTTEYDGAQFYAVPTIKA